MQGMQTRRPLVAVLAALSAAAVLIAGCSFKSRQSGGPLPDAATLVQQSAASSKNVKSAHLVLKVIGTIAKLPVKTLTGDLTTTPDTAAKGNAQLTFMGRDISADFVVIGGDLYTNAFNPGDSAMTDVGPASQVYDPSAILNPDTGVANLLANFSDAKAEAREPIGNQTTIRISGNVTQEAVNKIAPPFNATKPVPATVWIVESGDHQLAQVSLQHDPGNAVQMTLSDWGKPVQIDKPAAS
jgi:lipoprotein LprG